VSSVILNYIVRGLVAIVGILLLTGVISINTLEDTTQKVLGAIMVIWGVYRIIAYYFALKNQKYLEGEEDDEDDEK